MEFQKGICPHCKGELQLPRERETIICMYCGRELSVQEALARQTASDCPKPVSEEAAAQALQELLYGIEAPMQHFKKNLYLDFFQKYIFENAKKLAALEQFYLADEARPDRLERAAELLAARVDEELRGLRGRKREERLMDYNLSLVVYVFPALLETNKRSGGTWADMLAAVWKKHFPKTDLKAATAEEINAGFRYRFCYITTAVCESRGKPDDCYELSLLRAFRDDYLLQSPAGGEMVREYYDVAPSIVKHIGRRADAEQIYADIWEQYLSPCIRLIETDRREECARLYREMVCRLKEQYFFNS